MEIKATSLSQEELKSKAVMFCEDFGEVDKKTISKIVEDFEKEHKRVVTMFQIQFLKKWADKKAKGEDGRSDVLPKTYFQEDEDLLNMIQNVTIHQ